MDRLEFVSKKGGFNKLIFALFIIGIVANSLGAYSIANIPISWCGEVIVFFTVCLILLFNRLYIIPGTKIIVVLFFWSIIVTFFNISLNDYSAIMPSSATTSYVIFIFLRGFSFISFISVLYSVYWLIANGYKPSLIKWIVNIGVAIAVLSLYIYAAQIYGLPELPRTRMGTGGMEQSIEFSYYFHRAMGTFREPSHLAQWLIVPLFMSFITYKNSFSIKSIIIGSCLLLTGSLTGILATIGGFAAAMLLANPFKMKNIRLLTSFFVITIISLILFSIISVQQDSSDYNLFSVIVDRVNPILFENGMESSNRSYIYEYLNMESIPFWGGGFGNSNIILSKYLGSNLVASFLSIYFNFLYSSGIPGLVLLIIFLFFPVFRTLVNHKVYKSKEFHFCLASYFAWLIVYAVHAEFFEMLFGVSWVLLISQSRQNLSDDQR